jgi:hypothetical protein
MVDVVVEQKPQAKLSYDPEDIPDAVKQRVAAVGVHGLPAEPLATLRATWRTLSADGMSVEASRIEFES